MSRWDDIKKKKKKSRSQKRWKEKHQKSIKKINFLGYKELVAIRFDRDRRAEPIYLVIVEAWSRNGCLPGLASAPDNLINWSRKTNAIGYGSTVYITLGKFIVTSHLKLSFSAALAYFNSPNFSSVSGVFFWGITRFSSWNNFSCFSGFVARLYRTADNVLDVCNIISPYNNKMPRQYFNMQFFITRW